MPLILVADDDVLIRMLLIDVLTEAGFEVVDADHGEEALRLLCSRANGFDALFTDINMPGSMDGLELARRAYCRLPHLWVVIGSGGRKPPPDALPPGSLFLPKPYHVTDIPRLIRELLTSPQRVRAHAAPQVQHSVMQSRCSATVTKG